MDFETCMDVLDWFDDSELYEYLHHVSVSRLDADACIGRILPMLRNRVRALMDAHIGTEIEYPYLPA